MRDGIVREWVPTKDVKVGDKISCLLSDASADLEVTGWEDKVIDLTRYGLGVSTYRHFKVSWAPWWACDMKAFRLDGPEGKALVLARKLVHYGASRTACGDLRMHDTATTFMPAVTCEVCLASIYRSA
ncbi:hypothetical protein AB0L74_10165 [Streptomyces sp. NPDC052020]|uniref:hypothetical protein n=1 Tax=Streptomyces sp. NPDC052020 TaxID=3155677 RepID=UPI0034121AAB